MKKIPYNAKTFQVWKIVKKLIKDWGEGSDLGGELEEWMLNWAAVDSKGGFNWDKPIDREGINSLNSILQNYDMLGENKMTKQQKLKRIVELMINKELYEAKYEDPLKGVEWDDIPKDERMTAYKLWSSYNSQFYDLANLLTNSTGFWYVGTGKNEIAELIKQKTPDELKQFRKEMADLIRKSRSAEKIMRDVKITAQNMIDSLKK